MVNCQIGENVIMQPSETQSLKGMKGESDRECRVVGKKKLSREGGGIFISLPLNAHLSAATQCIVCSLCRIHNFPQNL